MKAVIYTAYGSPDVLHPADIDQPTPAAHEVLVKVHASTVTTGDCNARGFVFVPTGFQLIARLMFGINKPKKPVLGVEFAGEVAAVGSAVTRFKPGDAVFGIDGNRLGAYAEYKTIAETAGIVHKPANLSYAEAAAIPNGALTALTFLRNLAKIQPGQSILIYGASGSVGSSAVQLARHFGAEVTGVCSTRNVDLVRSLGASRVIDYTREDFTAGKQTYEVIFDTVGKTSFRAARHLLKPHGLFLTAAGGIPDFLRMGWTGLRGGKKVIVGMSSERQDDLQLIQQLAAAGEFRPVIDRSYPLAQTADAHRYVDSGRKRGSVVITVVPQLQPA